MIWMTKLHISLKKGKERKRKERKGKERMGSRPLIPAAAVVL